MIVVCLFALILTGTITAEMSKAMQIESLKKSMDILPKALILQMAEESIISAKEQLAGFKKANPAYQILSEIEQDMIEFEQLLANQYGPISNELQQMDLYLDYLTKHGQSESKEVTDMLVKQRKLMAPSHLNKEALAAEIVRFLERQVQFMGKLKSLQKK